jgi:hypothetical protein
MIANVDGLSSCVDSSSEVNLSILQWGESLKNDHVGFVALVQIAVVLGNYSI